MNEHRVDLAIFVLHTVYMFCLFRRDDRGLAFVLVHHILSDVDNE